MNNHRLDIIQLIIQTLNDSQIPKSNLSGLLEILADKFSATRSFLLMHQEQTDRLTPIAVNGLDVTEFRRLESKAEKSLFRTVFESGEAVIVSHLSSEPSLSKIKSSEFLRRNS
jgi:hypothetical protein